MLDELNLSQMKVGMNARMEIIHQTPDWIMMGTDARNVKILVALMQEYYTDLPSGDDIDWLGCPAVPQKVLEAIQKSITVIDTLWKSPTPSKTIKNIRQI